MVRQKDGRRNRYQIQAYLPLPEPVTRDLAIGEVLALLPARDPRHRTARPRDPPGAGRQQRPRSFAGTR